MIPPETIVVNFKKEKCDVKITRTPKNSIPDPPIFGCFGNPYPVANYGRKRCIELFRAYFYKRIESDPAFRTAVLGLKGKRLGCFCKAAPGEPNTEDNACHGDIYKEWLDQQEA